MYICVNCGELFEFPMIYYEQHGFESPPYEEIYGCPFCGSDYYHTQKCTDCGEYIDGGFVKTSCGVFCEDCYTTGVITEDCL